MDPYEIIEKMIMNSDLKNELDHYLVEWSIGGDCIHYIEKWEDERGYTQYTKGLMHTSTVLLRWMTKREFNTEGAIETIEDLGFDDRGWRGDWHEKVLGAPSEIDPSIFFYIFFLVALIGTDDFLN